MSDEKRYAVCVIIQSGRTRVFFRNELAAAEQMYEHMVKEYPHSYVDLTEKTETSFRRLRRRDEVTA